MDAKIFVDQESIALSGSLNFKNVLKIWQESLNILPDKTESEIDLSKVTHCDSAGLCLLLEWYKWAQLKNKTIEFKNFPDQLKVMAELAGLADLLNIKNASGVN